MTNQQSLEWQQVVSANKGEVRGQVGKMKTVTQAHCSALVKAYNTAQKIIKEDCKHCITQHVISYYSVRLLETVLTVCSRVLRPWGADKKCYKTRENYVNTIKLLPNTEDIKICNIMEFAIIFPFKKLRYHENIQHLTTIILAWP